MISSCPSDTDSDYDYDSEMSEPLPKRQKRPPTKEDVELQKDIAEAERDKWIQKYQAAEHERECLANNMQTNQTLLQGYHEAECGFVTKINDLKERLRIRENQASQPKEKPQAKETGVLSTLTKCVLITLISTCDCRQSCLMRSSRSPSTARNGCKTMMLGLQ